MFERIKLPYAYDALEPYIDKETVETHYEKHHKAYTDKFNELLEDAPMFEGMSAKEILMNLEKAPAHLQEGLKNHGGGYYNHNLYFESMIPGGKPIAGKLKELVEARYGSEEEMLKQLYAAATASLFGSGWAWLILKDGQLEIVISKNQDSPLQEKNPNLLLPVDMWEHAFYLKYKNLKVDYVNEYYKVINWDVVAERLEDAEI